MPLSIVHRQIEYWFTIMISVINITAFFYPVIKNILEVEIIQNGLALIIDTVNIYSWVKKDLRALYIIALRVKAGLTFIILMLNINAWMD